MTHEDWIVQLVQATQDAVVTIDAEHRIKLFNAAAEAMFGYRADEVQGKDVSILMPDPYRSDHAGYVHRYEKTGEAHAIGRIRTVTARRRNGEEFPIELSVTRVAEGDARYGAFIRDISEKVRLQRELVQREKLAAIGTTAAKFAHEVSNPLNGMFTQIQLMKRRLERSVDADPRMLRGVEHIYGDLERLNNLLDEFRSLSRRQDYRFEPVSVGELCATTSPRIRKGSPRPAMGSRCSIDVPGGRAQRCGPTRPSSSRSSTTCARTRRRRCPMAAALSVSARSDGAQVVLSVSDTRRGDCRGDRRVHPLRHDQAGRHRAGPADRSRDRRGARRDGDLRRPPRAREPASTSCCRSQRPHLDPMVPTSPRKSCARDPETAEGAGRLCA